MSLDAVEQTDMFLEEANILIGPLKKDSNFENILSSYQILGDYSVSPEIMTFGEMDLTNKEYIDTTFRYAIEKLPSNWSPDKIIFWGFDSQIIPEDLEKNNLPLIGVVFNWHLTFESVINNLGRFDWIFTDKVGEQVLKNAGFNNVSSLLLRGFTPYLHRKIPTAKKHIDISFGGNLSFDSHPERQKFLYKIPKVSQNVRIISNVYGESYVNLINQSKISFNHCSNNRVNQRCFEIPACNSLLFVEDSNLEIRDYFTDKEECVLYNENNFEELLKFYLENDEERERVTANGYKKVQNYTFENIFENLLKEINKLDLGKPKQNRTFNKLDDVEQHKRRAKQALQSTIPGKFFFVEKELLEAAKKSKSIDVEVSNNLGVINANAYISLSQRKEKQLFTVAKNYFEEAIGYSPMYAIARFNLGYLYYLEEDYEKAESSINSFIMLLSSEPEKSVEKRGFVYLSPNISFESDYKVAWEKNLYENYNDSEEVIFGFCDILMAKSFELLGGIYIMQGDNDAAEEMYSNSAKIRDDLGNAKLSLANMLKFQGRFDEAYLLYKEIFARKPLEIEVWKGMLEILKQKDKKEEHNVLADELKRVSIISPKKHQYIRLFEPI